MIRSLALAAILLAPLQAAALSCSPPPLAHDTINAVAETSGAWVIGIGTMKQVSGGTRKAETTDGRFTTTQTYRFEGVLLRPGKPDQPIKTDVVATSCEGLWCPGPWNLKTGSEYLMVFDAHADQLTLSSGLCGGSLVISLTGPEHRARVAACAQTSTCTRADLAR